MTAAPEAEAALNIIPARRRLPVVAITSLAALAAIWLGGFSISLFLGRVSEWEHAVTDIRYSVLGALAFVVIAMGVDLLVARLWSPKPFLGSGLRAAMRARWQGDRTDEEFSKATGVVLICLAIFGIFALLISASFALLAIVIIAIGCLFAGDQVVSTCRTWRYRYVPCICSALIQGGLIGLLIGYFGI